MFDSRAILKLYATVLQEDIKRNRVSEKDIRLGVRDMAQTYAPESKNFENDLTNRKYTNYNIAAFRCAYLHKFAPLHTYIVFDVMTKILNQEIQFFKSILTSKQFKLCCLGGGPGSDAVGVLAALHTVFRKFSSSVTVVDCMEQWKYTFGLVISYLQIAGIGLELNSFEWDYIGADLLRVKNMTAAVSNAINGASLITMIKFVSAATCTKTEPMVEEIFRKMSPGGLVLYIDNAANCFTQIIERISKKLNFQVIAGPYRHMEYLNEDLKIERFGYTSCFQTKVTIILMMKQDSNQNKAQSSSQLYYSSQSTATSKKKVPLQYAENTKKVTSKTRVITSSHRNKMKRHLQSDYSSQNISASKTKAFEQNVNEFATKIGAISSSHDDKTQSLSQSNCSDRSSSVSKRKLPSQDVENDNEGSSGIRVLTPTFLRKKLQNCSPNSATIQNISSSNSKPPLRYAQNTRGVSSGIRVLTPTFLRKNLQNPSQPSCSSQSISVSQRKDPIPNLQNINNASSNICATAQERANKPLLSNNNIRPSSCGSINNENAIRPSYNNSNYYDVYNREYDFDNDSANDTCCSCCVIS